MSTAALRLARLFLKDPARGKAEAERLDRDDRARKARVRAKPAAPVNRTRATAAEKGEFYEAAKREAAVRAGALFTRDGEMFVPPRCEYVGLGTPCKNDADDPDHVIGGSYRKECEALGAEGLMWLCRTHHDMKHANSPTRWFWLGVAEGFAERNGYSRLARMVARARARYEAKHPEHGKETTT